MNLLAKKKRSLRTGGLRKGTLEEETDRGNTQ